MDITDIADLNLNDSVLVHTLINAAFEVEMLVNYILDYSSQTKTLHKLVFRDCLSADFKVHLGFQGPNSILSGQEEPVQDGYRKFCIETNTTASLLTIVARRLTMEACVDLEA